MIKSIINKWSHFMFENGADIEDKDVYEYGMECIINEIFIDILLVLIAIIVNKQLEMVIWILSFSVLRINLGGYHAPTHSKCILGTIIVAMISVFTMPIFVQHKIISGMAVIICWVIVFCISPVIHPNHPISGKRARHFRVNSINIVILEGIIVWLGICGDSAVLINTIGGLVSATVLGVLGKLKF